MKYNLSTVTANDFTCELDISQRAYDDFLKNEYYPKGQKDNTSPALFLKAYLREKIEHILSKN